MNKLLVLGLALVPLTALAIACGRPGSDGSAEASNDISGSIGDARGCAASQAYEAADITNLETPADDQLPAAVRNATATATALAQLNVKGIGDVYAAQVGSMTILFDRNARVLAEGVDNGGWLSWTNADGKTLTCVGASSSSSGSWGDGGWNGSSSGWNGGYDAGDAGWGDWGGSSGTVDISDAGGD